MEKNGYRFFVDPVSRNMVMAPILVEVVVPARFAYHTPSIFPPLLGLCESIFKGSLLGRKYIRGAIMGESSDLSAELTLRLFPRDMMITTMDEDGCLLLTLLHADVSLTIV